MRKAIVSLIVKPDPPITLEFSEDELPLYLHTEYILGDAQPGDAFPDYDGPYTFTPKAVAQTASTKDRTTRKNMIFEGVDSVFNQADNDAGGYTVSIL